MFHYISCGLNNIWLRNGYTVRETPYGESVAIHDLEGLHKAIGLHIAENKPRLTGAEVRFLRTELDMSQTDMARIIGVSEISVRGWEKNRTKITKPAERMLRAIYTQHVNGNDSIRKLVERISQINRDVYKARLELEEMNGSWREAA